MAATGADPEAVSFALSSHETALCLIPPDNAWAPVDRLRALYDKAFRKWPPHVNLVYPFVQPESLDAACQCIQSFLKAEQASEDAPRAIDVQLAEAGVFNHRHEKTLYLHDARGNGSAASLARLRAGLVAALQNDHASKSSAKGTADVFHMHMTVAQSGRTAAGKTIAVEADAPDDAETPNDTLGHAHRFLLHKVESLPPVAWTADRLHILVRERLTATANGRSDGDVVAVSSRMRLWGVVHLADGRLEKLGRPEPLYDTLPFDDRGNAAFGVDDAEAEAVADKGAKLATFQAVTFVPEDGEWARCDASHALYAPLPSISGPGSLSIASYNVLGEFEWPPAEHRFPILIRNLLADNAAADVVVLQEVTDHFLSALLEDARVRSAYPFASHGPPDQEDMEPLPSLLNMAVLSRRPFSWSWLDFHRAHKGALVARFYHEDADSDDDSETLALVLATVHLTHGLTNGAVASKRGELQRLLGHLRREYPPHCADAVVLAGDVNIHTSSVAIEAALRRKAISAQAAQYVESGFDDLFAEHGFVDGWRAARQDNNHEDIGADEEAAHNQRLDSGTVPLHDGEEGATYNPFTNALAARIVGSGLNTRPERFDRILVRNPRKMHGHGDEDEVNDNGRSQYAISGFNLFGFPPPSVDHSSPDVYGSDHWGIRCRLECLNDDDSSGDEHDEDDGSVASPVSESAEEAVEKAHISAEVEKLIAPVNSVKAPAGPLAVDSAVEAALEHLDALPSEEDIVRRKEAFDRLKTIILDEKADPAQAPASKDPRQLVVVPVGSYGLGVWTPASDIDCLCIGTFSSDTFFALAGQRLRAAVTAADGMGASSVKIIRRVRAQTGTMLELEIGGIRMDLQYCSATVVAETWPSVLVLPPTHPVFALSPQTLSKLKAARDLYYLRKSFPETATSPVAPASPASPVSICTASNFRTAHRAIKTWARSRGLYAVRFGYLGGIQIAVLLARVMKLMQRDAEEAAAVPPRYTVADILVSFFHHYAGFDWATRIAFDPFFHSQKAPYAPTSREPLVILGYHRPQLNTTAAASLPSVRALAGEFRRASDLLRHHADSLDWTAFLSGGGSISGGSHLPSLVTPGLAPGPAEFVRAYRTYIKLDLQYWGLSLARGTAFVGWLESRCVLLLVDLARRLPELGARIWPGRFVDADTELDTAPSPSSGDANTADRRQYQGCYLVGLSLPAAMTREERRVALGTLQSVLAHFEKQIRRGGDGYTNMGNYDPQWMWIGVGIANRADLGDVDRLRLDSRAWGEHAAGEEEDDDDDEEEEQDELEDVPDEESTAPIRKAKKGKAKTLPLGVVHRPGAKFRTAQDVIKRLRWDPHLDRSDYIVGYEDRFLGARERPLEAWKSEQTDEEFIPQHRILYFRRRSDSVVVWDRRTRKDEVFGSGVRG